LGDAVKLILSSPLWNEVQMALRDSEQVSCRRSGEAAPMLMKTVRIPHCNSIYDPALGVIKLINPMVKTFTEMMKPSF